MQRCLIRFKVKQNQTGKLDPLETPNPTNKLIWFSIHVYNFIID